MTGWPGPSDLEKSAERCKLVSFPRVVKEDVFGTLSTLFSLNPHVVSDIIGMTIIYRLGRSRPYTKGDEVHNLFERKLVES